MGADQTRQPPQQPNNPQRQNPGQQNRQGQDHDRKAGKPANQDTPSDRDRR